MTDFNLVETPASVTMRLLLIVISLSPFRVPLYFAEVMI